MSLKILGLVTLALAVTVSADAGKRVSNVSPIVRCLNSRFDMS